MPADPRTDLQSALSRLAITRAEYAALLAACRASVAASAADDPDPVVYVRAMLAKRGQLPPPGAAPLVVLADARSALTLTGAATGAPTATCTGLSSSARPAAGSRPDHDDPY